MPLRPDVWEGVLKVKPSARGACSPRFPRALLKLVEDQAIMHRTISLTPIAAALLLLLAGCRDSAELPEQATQGPNPSLPRAEREADPDAQYRRGDGVEAG